MKIRYKGKDYESEVKYGENGCLIVGVKNPDNDILKVLKKDRIQRGLLLGELLCNPFYNLDEAIKNPLL